MMLDYLVIVLYCAAVIGIGVWCSRGEKTSENYLLGGRSVPFFAVGLACMMALLSSVSLVMVPGEIFNHGLTLFSLSGSIGLILVIPCYLLFTQFYFRLGSFTPYEYLEYRYDSTVRAVVAVSAFYTRTMYLGMVVFTTAKIFEASFHWPPWASILLVGVVGMIYTIKGGAKAVIWTDVLQFFVLFGCFAVVVVVLCNRIDGGAAAAVTVAFREGHGLAQYSEPDFYTLSPYVRLLFWLMLWGALATPLTTACSDQITIQRLLSTRNWKEGFKAQCVATGFAVLFTLILWFVGLAVFTYYRQNPDPAIGPNSGDAAFFHFVSKTLPSPLPGLFLAGMLAAIMSTLSSGMNSMATVWLKEFHEKFINRNLTPAGEVRVSKLATLWIGCFVIGFGLALEFAGKWLTQSVSEVGTIFYLLGAAILPAFLFAVLSKRANAKLIWGYTCFAFGEGVAMNLWYALSRSSEQAWKLDPAAGFGWAGKLPFVYAGIPLLLGILLLLPYASAKLRSRWSGRVSALVGLLALGFAEGMLVWYFYSQAMVETIPLARSFAFFLPISFIGAFIVLWFCPKQPEWKYMGLTLGTLGQKVIQKRPTR
ncbi:MAG: sodium/solute symporter [Victivallaceae bacterium]|nr:sodium/solute symporter [Victivallaceae bacterium]